MISTLHQQFAIIKGTNVVPFVISQERIVKKLIYLNVRKLDIALKQDMICRMDVLVMEVSPDITEKTIVAQQVMNM